MPSKIEKHCVNCKTSFFVRTSRKTQKYCTRECFYLHVKKINENKTNVNCDICNKAFYKKPAKIKTSKGNYCSVECTNKSFELPKYIQESCTHCHKSFERKRINRPKNKELRFCSPQCSNEYNGKFNRGSNHFNFNNNLTNEERIYKRDTYENIKWRISIFKKDEYTCKVCSQKGGDLNAHHFENYSTNKEKRFDINNGVTMCLKCHKNFHDNYGYKKNNKLQFEEFKSSYMIKSKKRNFNG
jgi:hypothetical protein